MFGSRGRTSGAAAFRRELGAILLAGLTGGTAGLALPAAGSPPSSPSCTPAPTVLCLDDVPGDRRFRVTVEYATTQGGGLSGSGQAIPLGPLGVGRGGLFWFFGADNPEMLVKVLNACSLNDSFWVFFSAGTNVGFTLEVLDTHTGEVFASTNPDLRAAPPVQSTDALPCTVPPRITSLAPSQGPIAGGTTVTLHGSGFSAAGLAVTFDGVPATSVELVGPAELRVVTPPHDNGYVAVVLSADNGTASAQYLYTPPPLAALRDGDITTVAGIGQYFGEGADARTVPFEPSDVAVGASGSVAIAEPERFVIREVRDGATHRVAGRGFPAPPATQDEIGDGGPAREATINYARGVAVGPDGSVYVADTFNHRVRRVERSSGTIDTVAGSGPIAYEGGFAGDGGPAIAARLDQPNQVGFDGAGNWYLLDAVNARIRKVTTDGIIRTVAGNGTRGFGGDGGPATSASFDIGPNGDVGALAVDPAGNLILADSQNQRFRRIDAATGRIATVAGGGTRTDEGAPAVDSMISADGVAFAPDGSFYVSDVSRIRHVRTDGRVFTLFGTTTPGFSPDGARPPSGQLTGVGRMRVDAARDRLLFVEGGAGRVRAIDLGTRELTTIAGIGPAAFGENGPAVAAELDAIVGQLAVTAAQELIVTGLRRLRRLEPDGTLRTIAGGGFDPIGGPPPAVRPALGTPLDSFGVAAAPDGSIYVAGTFEVGRITPDGVYRRIAGGAYGYTGDGGPAAQATFDNPSDLALDAAGNLFVADTWNHVIRRIDALSGVITTVAGTYLPHPPNVLVSNTSTGDGGPATQATMNQPQFIAIDGAGNLYVTDNGVRRVDAAGVIDTVLGPSPSCGGGPLARDVQGRIYVRCFDGGILRIDGPGATTEVGRVSNSFGFSGDGGPAAQAEMRNVYGMAIDGAGNVYLNDAENRRIRALRGIAH